MKSNAVIKLRWNADQGLEMELSPNLVKDMKLQRSSGYKAASKPAKRSENALSKSAPDLGRAVLSRRSSTKSKSKKLRAEDGGLFLRRGLIKDIGPLVVGAIKSLNDKKGSSIKDIKRYIAREKGLNVESCSPDIKSFFGNAVKSGLLSQSDGKYKVAAQQRRRKSRKPRKIRKTARKVTKRRKTSGRRSKRGTRRRNGGRKASTSKAKGSGRRKRTVAVVPTTQ